MPDPANLSSSLLAIFHALPGAYLIFSADLIIQAASDAFLEATLIQRETLVGRYLFDAFPDNPQAPQAYAVRNLKNSIDQVLATGKPHQMARQHYDVPDPENSGQFVERYWLPENIPMLDKQGQVQFIIHATRNVTQMVRAESQLQDSQVREQRAIQQMDSLFLQAPAAICILDGPEFVYELVNPGYQKLFPGRHLLGKPLLEVVPEMASSAIYQASQRVYQTGKPHYESSLLLPFVRPQDGVVEERYFTCVQQARYDWYGRIDGVIIFAFDITDQVQARQQVEQMAQELTASNQQLSRVNNDLDNFVYTASHDLKSPLLNLEGLINLLPELLSGESQASEQVRQVLQMTQENVERFKKTLSDLSQVATWQLEAGPITLLELPVVAREVLQDLAPQVQEARAEIKSDWDAVYTKLSKSLFTRLSC